MSYEDVKKEAREIFITLINELEREWKKGLINTRWELVNYCIGRYGAVTESVALAINDLYFDAFIKA